MSCQLLDRELRPRRIDEPDCTVVKRANFFAQAAKLGGLTLASSALGFTRELMIARQFGASNATDAYLVALSVPTLAYALFFGSGLNVSLVPRLTILLKSDQAEGRAMFAQFLSGAAFCSALGSCIILFMPGTFIRMFAPGIAHSTIAADFVCILAPLLFLSVISFALGSFHCANDQAAHWGLIPVVQNVTLVSALFICGNRWGMKGLLAGTIGGAFLAFLVQARIASGDGFSEPWSDPFRAGLGRDILAGMTAFALVGGLGGDSGTAQADIFLIRFFASGLGTGNITLLALGNKLAGFPVVVIGAAIGLALLPSLSVAVAKQDRGNAGLQLSQALSFAFLIVCPIAVIYFDLGGTIVRAVFRHTALLNGQLAELGQILRAYSGAVIGMVVVFILNAYLAALRRTRALISAGVFSVVVDAGLMWFLRNLYGTRGIALGISVGSFVYCGVLLMLLWQDLSPSLRWTLLARAMLITTAAIGMHMSLLSVIRLDLLRSRPWFGGMILPIAAGVTVYLGWLGLNRTRLLTVEKS